jgi:hypothetical protein
VGVCHGFAGFTGDEITTAKLVEMANQVSGGEQVDENNTEEWFECDACEMLNNDNIVRSLGREEKGSESEGEGEGIDTRNKISHGDALNHLDQSGPTGGP